MEERYSATAHTFFPSIQGQDDLKLECLYGSTPFPGPEALNFLTALYLIQILSL